MEILQWVFMIGVAITIIFLIFSIYNLVMSFIKSRNIKKIEVDSRQRKKKKLIMRLKKEKKRNLFQFILFFLVAIATGTGSAYVTYYQATNLSKEDMANITDGFYYLRDLKTELEEIQKGKVEVEKAEQTINFVVTSLAGYSVKKASTLNTVEGQRVLNRYYLGMAELGINVSRNSASLISNPDILKESLEDINKIQSYQKKALIFYKVDVPSLESEK